MKCKVPPAGWRCTREAGHDGPCAAIKIKKKSKQEKDLKVIKVETRFQTLHIKAQTKILTEVCRDMKAHRRDFKVHSEDDIKRFETIDKDVTKLKTNQAWIMRIGTFLFGAFGLAKILGQWIPPSNR